MSHPEIIIPFALPPAEHARDLLRLLSSEYGSAGLATLLARASTIQRTQFDDFSARLPHESWLSKQHRHNPLLHHCARLALTLDDGYWYLLHPVHLHIASNHLVLTDYRQLALPDNQARALFDKAQALCKAAGTELVYGDATHWFLRADAWSGLSSASPDAACGHNIEIWSPKGEQELAWRKLQNEIQMEWFIEPIQEQRQLRGDKPVNGLWLWAGTENPMRAETSATNSALSATPDLRTFLRAPGPALLEQLVPFALAGDWNSWARQLGELERSWLIPLRAALKSGQVSSVRLVLSNSNTLLDAQVSRSGLRRFWRSPNFNHLR